jgi:sulfonate transport system substrate-binding protein
MQALAAGEIHIASVLGGSSAILGKANGIDVKVIAAYSRSPKAYMILAMPNGPADIKSLKGKTVAGPKGTVLHQLLAAALAKNGLRLSDVDHVNMDLPSARAALLAGKVDAATLAGNNALAIEKANGKLLASGDGLLEPTTVIGVRGDLIDKNPQIVAAYLAAHRKALAFMKANPEEALKIAAADQKIDLEDARKMMTYYDFALRVTDRDIANLGADQDFMVEAGMLKTKIDIAKDLISPAARTLE